jgi:hypothetical protein
LLGENLRGSSSQENHEDSARGKSGNPIVKDHFGNNLKEGIMAVI